MRDVQVRDVHAVRERVARTGTQGMRSHGGPGSGRRHGMSSWVVSACGVRRPAPFDSREFVHAP